MNFEIGNIVSRISHNHDILFKIIGFQNNLVLLQGVNVRLSADCKMDDLVLEQEGDSDDEDIIQRNLKDIQILSNELGKPYIKIKNTTKEYVENHFGNGLNFYLSLSDDYPTATAFVIIEKEN